MINTLNNLALTTEGKKKLLCTYYALQSKKADKDSLKKYLKNNYSNICSLELRGSQIKHTGCLINIFSFDTFKNVYLNKKSNTSYRKVSSKLDTKSVDWHLSKLSPEDYNYGIKIAPPYSSFLWVTDAGPKSLRPDQLGLDSLHQRDIVAIQFPEKVYTLYYPTIIEGYGSHQSGWHYGNIDSDGQWGKAIDIEKIDDNCTEKDINGKNEALLEALEFNKEHKIISLGRDTQTQTYYSQQYTIFLNKIENEFYSPDVLEFLIAELA